jgi:hypothetical protein
MATYQTEMRRYVWTRNVSPSLDVTQLAAQLIRDRNELDIDLTRSLSDCSRSMDRFVLLELAEGDEVKHLTGLSRGCATVVSVYRSS